MGIVPFGAYNRQTDRCRNRLGELARLHGDRRPFFLGNGHDAVA